MRSNMLRTHKKKSKVCIHYEFELDTALRNAFAQAYNVDGTLRAIRQALEQCLDHEVDRVRSMISATER